MSDVKVSIIVPCYNVEQYLPRCLDSLVGQSLEDIEIICINDGSPDRCIDILHEYRNGYPGKIVIIDKENEGVWRARYDAIAIAKGEYIGFLDSDDYAEPNFCEKLYECAIENKADIAVCGFNRIDSVTGKILNSEMVNRRTPFNAREEPQRLLELNGAPWNKIFKAHLLKNLHDFKDPPRIFDDMIMHLVAYPHVTRIAFTPYALVNYIIRNGSIMTTIDKSKIDSCYESMLEVKEVYKEEGGRDLLEFLDAAAFLHMGISLMFRVSYDRTANLRQILRENRVYLDENFQAWRSDRIISFSNAIGYGGSLKRVYIARLIYEMGLMRIALKVYRLMISKEKDIKW